jgi:hypothetical protein
VRVGTCDYSVHPKAIGRRVEVKVDPALVVITLAGEVVGRHQRSFAKHRSITDPDHVRAAQAMRVAAANWTGIKTDTDEVEVRDLSVYDPLTRVA